MRNLLSALISVVMVLTLSACNHSPSGPTPPPPPPVCGGADNPCPIRRTPVDPPGDDGFHILKATAYPNPPGSPMVPVTMRVRLNWVARYVGNDIAPCEKGCFQMSVTACMDPVPNPRADPNLASMMIRFYFSENGISPGPFAGSSAFANVANGACTDINQDGTAGSMIFPGTRFLIAWATPGPSPIEFGQRGPRGEIGGAYVWDLISQGF